MTYGVRDVEVSYRSRSSTPALHSLTVPVTPGSIVAAVGGDGAGKTTLLRVLVGQLTPDRGVTDAPGRERIGYLPASKGSWAELTVRENVDFAGQAYGITGARLEARRVELLGRAGLLHVSDRLAGNLSGGMRRKLGFCLAMVHDPALLVLDEPTTGVDPVSRIDLWRLVSRAAAGGAAVILSTTYLDEAERAGRIVVLDRGRALAQGSWDEIRSGFRGVVTSSAGAVRQEWSWRRGRYRREYWPHGDTPAASAETVAPDLEDVVVSLSLAARLGTVAP